MICVSLKEKNAEKLTQILKKVEFAEIRLDSGGITLAEVRKIFSGHSNLIATCRPGALNDTDRKIFLLTAAKAGAAYLDIEVESDNAFKHDLIREARAQGCRIIVSYHNHQQTPDRAELDCIISRCFDSGADLAKIACHVRTIQDNARLLGILSGTRPIVVIGMGRLGKITRIAGPLLGSPFTYASFGEGKETAPGQINHLKLAEILKRLKNV